MSRISPVSHRSIRQQLHACGLLLASSLVLAGCGGGGGLASVSSAPGPIAPSSGEVTADPQAAKELIVGDALAPTPALTSGGYDTIALVIEEDTPPSFLAPGSLTVAVDSTTNTYSFTFDPVAVPELSAKSFDDPDGQIDFQVDDEAYGHEYVATFSEDGVLVSVEGEGRSASLYSHIFDEAMFTTSVGQSYVSLGQWSWPHTVTDANGVLWTGDWVGGSLLYVYGDRTAPGDIPTLGTATYRVASATDILATVPINTAGGIKDFGNPGPFNLDIAMTADFGAQSIAAAVEYDILSDDVEAYHYDLSGHAPISELGDFDIALSGSRLAGSFSEGMFASGSELATASPDGQLVGAFFGPNADQIGGTMAIPGSRDYNMIGVAFVATQP